MVERSSASRRRAGSRRGRRRGRPQARSGVDESHGDQDAEAHAEEKRGQEPGPEEGTSAHRGRTSCVHHSVAARAASGRAGRCIRIQAGCGRRAWTSGARSCGPRRPVPEPAPPRPAARRALTVSELTDRIQGRARDRVRGRLGRGRGLEPPRDAFVRPLVLHPQGREGPDPRGGVEERRAVHQVPAPGRHEGAGARRRSALRAAGRVPALGPGDRAPGQGLPAAGLRGAEGEARQGRASSPRPASGRSPCCRSGSAS